MSEISGVKTPNSQRAIDQAAAENLEVVFPAANELQIDIDNQQDMDKFHAHLDILHNHVGVGDWVVRPSKSGETGKAHITVTLNREVSNLERILLQAVMGSDRKREILSYVQELNKDPHPTLFLEKKQETLAAAAGQ